LHVGVHQQRVHGLLVALHHVEHAVGQTRLLEQVGDHQAGAGVDGAGLEHKGVARSNRHREHPHRHHHREVERRDARHHAQRLAQRPVVDAGGDLVGVVALEQLRDAAGKFHDVDAARDTSPCASVNTLPCSAVMAWARSSLCWLSSSRNLNSTRARRMGGVSAQAGNAAFADATAASTSAWSGQGHAARHAAGGRIEDVLSL
jgi:hypothetical protein